MEVRIFVRNIESGKGEWFDLPVTEDDVREKLGNPEEDFEYEVEASEGLELEGVNDIDKINDFVEELENYDSDIVEALIECGYDTIKELECINIGDCMLYPDVRDDYDLGKYIVEDIHGGIQEMSQQTLESYFDYRAFGKDVNMEVTGDYCKKGFIQIP